MIQANCFKNDLDRFIKETAKCIFAVYIFIYIFFLVGNVINDIKMRDYFLYFASDTPLPHCEPE